jgi:hypothetical protein
MLVRQEKTASRISTAKLTKCLGGMSLTKKVIGLQSHEGNRACATAAVGRLVMTSSSSYVGVWRKEVPLFLVPRLSYGYSPTLAL